MCGGAFGVNQRTRISAFTMAPFKVVKDTFSKWGFVVLMCCSALRVDEGTGIALLAVTRFKALTDLGIHYWCWRFEGSWTWTLTANAENATSGIHCLAAYTLPFANRLPGYGNV